MKRENNKRGWDVTASKAVKYSYIQDNGGVFTAHGKCVGNINAGDFLAEVPKHIQDLEALVKFWKGMSRKWEKSFNEIQELYLTE